MKLIHPSPLLKLALIADAVVSGAVGALQALMPGFLADLLRLPSSLLMGTGIFLIGYTVLLLVLACSTRVWSALVGFIVVGNIGWAVGCRLFWRSMSLLPVPGVSHSC